MQPACVIAVQTFGELVNFDPHLHIIASNGCFTNNGTFNEGISPNANDLLVPFAKAVLKMLKKEKAISLAVINNMSTWQHSGFNIHCGSPVSVSDADAIERLARYIVRSPISQERLKNTYRTTSLRMESARLFMKARPPIGLKPSRPLTFWLVWLHTSPINKNRLSVITVIIQISHVA